MSISVPGCKVSETGLQIEGKLTQKRWEEIGSTLGRCNRALMWWVGDWLLAGETGGYIERGKLDEACERFGVAYQTAANAKWVCENFESSARAEQLSFKHHETVAGRADAEELLDWAARSGATVKELREEKKRRAIQQIRNSTPAIPSDRFDLILCDPPWQYDFAETDNRKIENHYPTMPVEEICNLEPPAASDCLLFMWATAPKLREAFQVIDAWGFEYKTHGVWDKQMIGMGYWFRGQHELLFVATSGDVSPPGQEHRISSLFSEKRGRHSAKPACVYEWIEKAFPNRKKCEMFARKVRNDWHSWGNEV